MKFWIYRVRQVFKITRYMGNIFQYIMVRNLYLLPVDISEPRIAEEMKRHDVISSLAEEQMYLQIFTFLILAQSFVFNVSRELKATRFHVANFLCWK